MAAATYWYGHFHSIDSNLLFDKHRKRLEINLTHRSNLFANMLLSDKHMGNRFGTLVYVEEVETPKSVL